MHPMILLGILSFAVLYAIGRMKPPIKLPGMTDARREQVLRIRRFQDRYAHLKAEDSAKNAVSYGPLSDAQVEQYRAARERLRDAA